MSEKDIAEEIPEEVLKRAMRRVLEAEKEKLHMRTPHGVRQDIKAIIEEEVE